MTVNFYANSSDKRKIQKQIGNVVFTTNAEIYELCSLIYPAFRIAYNSVITTCNYLYVPEWHRYYFIDDVTFDSGGQMIVKCTEDVLMSNANQILNLRTLVSRYEKAGLTTIPDTNIIIKDYNIINVYNSGKSFDTQFGNYVLELYGG